LAVGDWFVEVCQHHQLIEIPVSGLIFARATELEPVHNDPADRILIATALQHSLTLVTPDHVISSYANLQTLW
jgi:PIN domain nuclease of toxin-antitoxin system